MTIEQTPIQPPSLGESGEPCRTCGSPLAPDQRYCLDCGARRSSARVEFMEILTARIKRESGDGDRDGGTTTALREPSEPWWRSAWAAAGAGVALLVLILGVGVLIGSSGEDGKQVAQAAPQIIRVESGGTPATPQETFTSDWPEGQDGFTVQLQTLPKTTTQVTAVTQAKTDVTAQGATEVGALDSDQFSALDPGNYVIYSGIFETRKQAQKALKGVKKNFPEATVIEITGGGGLASGGGDPDALSGKKKSATVDQNQLKDLQKLPPDEYQKKSQKLPDETKLPGKAPPKDNKKPGGGDEGGGEVIK